jgi:hypothetical protein
LFGRSDRDSDRLTEAALAAKIAHDQTDGRQAIEYELAVVCLDE